MTKKSLLVVSIFFLLITIAAVILYQIFVGFSLFTEQEPAKIENQIIEQHTPPAHSEQSVEDQIDDDYVNADPLMEIIEQLTIEEKVGQLLIAGIHGTSLNKNTKQLLDQYKVGNLILFKRNIKDEQQLKQFTDELHQHVASNIPLSLSIDQEGGIVNRLPQSFPAAEKLGQADSIAETSRVGNEIGEQLHELGFQMNFAPVLDINSNPNNPIIGSRAYGSTAEVVSKHSIATIEALQAHQIIAVGKHFPGHGDTFEDSHLTLPVINKSWEQLMELELIPFIQAIDHQINGIMVGHLFVSQVDAIYPASLSYELVTNRLRKELGFEGLIITDDLEMNGITNQYTVGQAAVLAIQAGADMIIIGHKLEQQLDALEQLTLAVKEGKIEMQQLNDRVYRILSYKMVN